LFSELATTYNKRRGRNRQRQPSKRLTKMRKGSVVLLVAFILLLILIFILVYVFFEDCLNWTAIAALAGTLVLFWAVFQQAILKWLERPILEISDYRHEPPFFRQAPQLDRKGREVAKGYYVNLLLINQGETVANYVQPHLSAIWEFKNGAWRKERNWLSVGLRWIFDELNKKPTEDKYLVPHRPYRFNLLELSTLHPDTFELLTIFRTTGQKWEFPRGKYCFEVTISGERLKPIIRYYLVDFREGGINDDFDSVKTKIIIAVHKGPPE